MTEPSYPHYRITTSLVVRGNRPLVGHFAQAKVQRVVPRLGKVWPIGTALGYGLTIRKAKERALAAGQRLARQHTTKARHTTASTYVPRSR